MISYCSYSILPLPFFPSTLPPSGSICIRIRLIVSGLVRQMNTQHRESEVRGSKPRGDVQKFARHLYRPLLGGREETVGLPGECGGVPAENGQQIESSIMLQEQQQQLFVRVANTNVCFRCCFVGFMPRCGQQQQLPLAASPLSPSFPLLRHTWANYVNAINPYGTQ